MITYKLETVTPFKAMELLKGNLDNRKINNRLVEQYADAIKRGEWTQNGESIKMNGTKILDGQHRLLGCIKAGKSFRTLLIRGLPDSVQKTIDTGMKRTNAHHFQMLGEPNSNLLAQTITKILGYYSTEFTYAKQRVISNIQAEKCLAENPGIRELVSHYGSVKSAVVPRALAGACHYIFQQIDEDQAEEFMSALITGAGLTSGSPILQLRSKLIRDLTSERKMSMMVKYAYIIKVWNLCRQNKTVKRLKYQEGNEKFPVAI